MCGRFSITKEEEELEKRFAARFYSEVLEKRYNIAPSQESAVITNKEPNSIQLFRWGLVPFWAKDVKIGYKMINARSETIAEKPAFKYAFEKRRCLVIADGFYEWQKKGKIKIPHRIMIGDSELVAFAGLWENWKDEKGDWLQSFTIITTDAVPRIHHLHDRMPVILRREDEKKWIEEELDAEEAKNILQRPQTDLNFYPVSPLVNSPANDVAEILERVEPPGEPGELF
ncbi:MAG: SOS response-associated peptidase [Chitinophagales bacterium]|nr:SOS response-associated peptidase [Chitinophagales bacterium]